MLYYIEFVLVKYARDVFRHVTFTCLARDGLKLKRERWPAASQALLLH